MEKLRKEAEKLIEEKQTQENIFSELEMKSLIHELQVHQIELEIQNQELVESRKELERIKKEYFDLFHLAPVGYMQLDNRGTIQNLNLKCCEILGRAHEFIISRPFVSFVNPKDMSKFYHHLEVVNHSQQKQSVELSLSINTYESNNHNKLVISNIDVEMHTTRNIQNQFFCTITDISERKQFEQSLIDARIKAESSDKLKTVFLHNIAHEVRTPLNAVIGFSNIIKIKNLDEGKLKGFSEIVVERGLDLLKLIERIILISQIEIGDVIFTDSITDVNLLIVNEIEYFTKKLAKGKDVKFEFSESLPENTSRILIDAPKLKEIITNLLDNAQKFSEKGTIEISVNHTEENQLLFAIKDCGIGILPENFEMIFDRFRQVDETMNRQYQGMGLGLYISKRIVELLNGKIWVESKLEQGTTFYFTVSYK